VTKDKPLQAPKYRKQKSQNGSDRAFIELNGVRHYIGRYGSREGRQAYHRLIAEWEANGRQMPVAPDEITIIELSARYWRHAQGYYVNSDGSPTSTQSRIRVALRPLKAIYGPMPAAEFGPAALRTTRESWVKAGLSRKTINDYTTELKHMFKWAASHELIAGTVHHTLSTVEGLRKGRSNARDTERVTPVPIPYVEAIDPHVSRQVWAMVQLQLFTSARSGEIVLMRAIDLDTTGRVWTYRPQDHKNSWRGCERTIFIGPRGQAVVKPFLAGRAVDDFLLSPLEAERERHAVASTHRHQPVQSSRTDRTVGDHYTTDSYRRSIERACRVAGVPRWTPHQLRHTAATDIRKEFGLEAAQIMLGHARADVTQIYAETNAAKAVEIAAKIG